VRTIVLKRVLLASLGLAVIIPSSVLAQAKLPPNLYGTEDLLNQQSGEVQQPTQGARSFSNRLIIELADPALYSKSLADLQSHLQEMALAANLAWRSQFKLGARFVVVELEQVQSDQDIQAAAERLKATPGVLNVEMDPVVQEQSISLNNDTRWTSQFDLFNATGTRQNFSNADYYLPNYLGLYSVADQLPVNQVSIAVIDSGYKTGFSDISASTVDHEVSILDGVYTGSAVDNPTNPSSSHGTETAATIFALKNNNSELAGLVPAAQSVIIKVFKNNGSGSLSDAAAGILYATNRHDQSVYAVTNPIPAKVINLSLGAFLSTCPTYLQDAVNQATDTGAIIVAAAGNQSLTSLNSPANCTNVVSVGAANSIGRRSNYSNASASLVVSTFGGDETVSSFFPVLSTQSNKFTQGTSNASPLVASVLAMAKSAVPSLTAAQAIAAITQTGKAFASTDSACAGKSACGVLFDPVAFLIQVGAINASMVPSPQPPTQNNTAMAQVQTSAIATSISDVVVYDSNQQVVNNATITILADRLDVELSAVGSYTVQFRGIPVTNTSVIKPAAAGDGKQLYQVQLTWQSNQAVQVGQIQPLASDQGNNTSQPAAVVASGGGGGGLGFVGVFILALLTAAYVRMRQVRKPLRTSARSD
jgi:serine protease